MSIFKDIFKQKSFKDPVCGMSASDGISSEYNGNSYYFCSAHCKQEFDAAPDKYVKDGE